MSQSLAITHEGRTALVIAGGVDIGRPDFGNPRGLEA
jgi:hypothetical protein